MSILTVDLKGFVEELAREPEKRYAVAVIDNAPPRDLLPLIGDNFLWVRKTGSVPTNREDLVSLFNSYQLNVGEEQPIAVFHHHDLDEPYLEFEGGVECYEFSHSSALSYEAFCHADTTILSHMLSKTFYGHDRVVLIKADIDDAEIEGMQQQHWFLQFEEWDHRDMKELGVGLEDFALYRTARMFGSGRVIPDPKRYQPDVHDKIFELGLAVDQYAIPAMFKFVEIQTGTDLDRKIVHRISETQTSWQEQVKEVKKEKEVELARIAQEERERERGELVPSDAVDHINSIAPSLGYDRTYEPVYADTRKDLAAVRRLVENGSSYGYDIIYLVYQTDDGIQAKKLIDSSSTKDYMSISSVEETESGISVKVGSGGSYSGEAWEKCIEVSFKEIEQSEPSTEAGGLAEGISDMTTNLFPGASEEVGIFMGALSESVARDSVASQGKKSNGKEKLELVYSDLVGSLSRKYPDGLTDHSRLELIVEVYEDELVKETFALLEAIDDKYRANMALHILGEMAMLKNAPELYLRVIKLLGKKASDEDSIQEILYDDRLEFQSDDVIEQALSEYE